MGYRRVLGTSTTIGRSAVGEGKLYVYGGDKPLKNERPPGPGGEANAGRKRARLARFEVILTELSGLSGAGLMSASAEHVRRAGVLVGVGEKTARTYWKDLLRREESTP